MISSYLHRLTSVASSEEENPLWLVVLCDMMTNLMLFFLIMYGFTRLPMEAREQMVKVMEDQFREHKMRQTERKAAVAVRQAQEDDLTRALQRRQVGQVATSETNVKITLDNPVLFISGEAALSDTAKAELAQLVPFLRDFPNTIVVEGHTDAAPIRAARYASNWELSVARAYSVVEYLTTAGGIPPQRLVTAGYGEHHPVASNDAPEGRARNRRIEIIVQRTRA